jgi:hypothetical protein
LVKLKLALPRLTVEDRDPMLTFRVAAVDGGTNGGT